jgi:hypothetical protein
MSEGIPSHFKLLDPEVAKKAVAGIECVFDGEHTKAEAIYRQHTLCPNGCGHTMEKSHGGTAFAFADPDWHIPRCLMKCHACGCSKNPFDGMLIERGDPNVARYGHIPILKKSDD